jgi:hypothetical protein
MCMWATTGVLTWQQITGKSMTGHGTRQLPSGAGRWVLALFASGLGSSVGAPSAADPPIRDPLVLVLVRGSGVRLPRFQNRVGVQWPMASNGQQQEQEQERRARGTSTSTRHGNAVLDSARSGTSRIYPGSG